MGKKLNKQLKQHFMQHDFEIARAGMKAFGQDLLDDLTLTAKAIQEENCDISVPNVNRLSPWMRFLATKIVPRMGPLQGQRYFKDAAHDYLRWLLFYGYGQQNFRLWPTLCEALLATEFKCPSELLVLPYNSISMQIPRSIGALLPIRNEDGTEYPASTVYVSLCRAEETGKPAMTVTVVSDIPGAVEKGEPGNNYHFLIRLDEPPPILDEEWILGADVTARDSHVERQDRECLRLVCNALLYITTPAADLVRRESPFESMIHTMTKTPRNKPPRPEKLARQRTTLRQQSMLRHTDTGRSVKIPNRGGGEDGEPLKDAWKIKHRFMVRGHWRLQAHGPGREERKLIWIQPFFKGDGLPTLAKREYDVSEIPPAQQI